MLNQYIYFKLLDIFYFNYIKIKIIISLLKSILRIKINGFNTKQNYKINKAKHLIKHTFKDEERK